MTIAIDSHIPFIRDVFEQYGITVIYSECIDPTGVYALVIRTRTQCNSTLLDGHQPKIIATATIGYDHIDIEYCRRRGIEVATAAGCNARAVAQWVFAALIEMGVERPTDHTLGIIGVGNVGSVVAQVARSVGFRVVMCDPPRASREQGFVSIESLLAQSSIVTIHTPLDQNTRSMANADFFSQMKSDAMFLNSSRGEVVDESALMKSSLKKIALDVWCNEPHISTGLLERVTIATPHIAGYSRQGKAMGTAMAVRSVATALGIEQLRNWYPAQITPTIPKTALSWQELIDNNNYDIRQDDHALRAQTDKFELLRSNYNYRNEYF